MIRNPRRLAMTALLACAALAPLTARAQAATDLGGVSVEAACDNQRGVATTARLVVNNVYGWRCALYLGGTTGYYSVDIARECRRVHGSSAYAAYSNYNNPYSWRCKR